MTKTTPDPSVETIGVPPGGRPSGTRLWIWGAIGVVIAVILVIWAVVAGGEDAPPTTIAAGTTAVAPDTTVAPTPTEAPTSIEAATTITSPTTTTPRPTVPPASEAVAQEFIEAFGTDATAAFPLFASDAVIEAAGIDDIADLAAWLDWNVAIGWDQTFEGCEPAGNEIKCGYTFTNPWMEARGAPPGTDSSFSLVVEDGVIMSAIEDLNWPDFSATWIAFTGWLDLNHPGARAKILTADDKPILTSESIALWQQYTGEFVGETVGNRFLDAFLSLDPTQLEAVAPVAADIHEGQYLQLWGAALGYQHTERFCETADALIVCTIEGTDALAAALDLTYVDTFDIRVESDGTARLVTWDPASIPAGALDEYAEWIGSAHPELFEQGAACDNFFGVGPSTPAACALEWLDAVPEYLQAG